jgi:hypothetical protein
MWAAFYLRGEIFVRFEPYITYYLEKGAVALCDKIIVNVMDTVRAPGNIARKDPGSF